MPNSPRVRAIERSRADESGRTVRFMTRLCILLYLPACILCVDHAATRYTLLQKKGMSLRAWSEDVVLAAVSVSFLIAFFFIGLCSMAMTRAAALAGFVVSAIGLVSVLVLRITHDFLVPWLDGDPVDSVNAVLVFLTYAFVLGIPTFVFFRELKRQSLVTRHSLRPDEDGPRVRGSFDSE